MNTIDSKGIALLAALALLGPARAQGLDTSREYMLVSALGSGDQVLDVVGWSRSEGAPLQTYRMHRGDNQRFRLLPVPGFENRFRLLSVHSGLAVTVENCSRSAGARAVQTGYMFTSCSAWDFENQRGGAYALRNVETGQYLEVAGASYGNYSRVQQSPGHGRENQRWHLRPETATVPTYFNRGIPKEAARVIRDYVHAGQRIACVAFGPGSWSVVTDRDVFSRNVPEECHQTMRSLLQAGDRIRCVAFPPAGGERWSIVTDRGCHNRGIDPDCDRQMHDYLRTGHSIRWVAFRPAGGWTVVTDRDVYSRNIPDDCHRRIQLVLAAGYRINCVAFPFRDPDGWVVASGAGLGMRGVPHECRRVASAMFYCPRKGLRVVAFHRDAQTGFTGFSIVSDADADGSVTMLRQGDDVFDLDRFAQNLRRTLHDHVVGYRTGAKYGFVVRKGFHIRGAAFGPKRTVHQAPAQDFTIYDRFNPASVTKLVTGVAVLRALERSGISVDARILGSAPHWRRCLPSTWNVHGDFANLTFRDVLRHETGIRGIPDGNGGRRDGLSYANLQSIMEAPGHGAVLHYHNDNYALARILVAYLDGYDESRHGDHARATSEAFIRFVQREIFDKIGIPDVRFDPDPEIDYWHQAPTLFHDPADPTRSTHYGSWSSVPGSAGIQLSLAELSIFMDRLANSTAILTAASRDLMDDGDLGWHPFLPRSHRGLLVRNGKGWALSKGGDFPANRNQGARLEAVAVKFDTGVQAVAVFNGDFVTRQSVYDAVVKAYDASWSKLFYGSSRTFGNGCSGGVHQAPVHTRWWYPGLGRTVGYRLQGAPPNQAALLLAGGSHTFRDGQRLPLPIHGAPGCSWLTDVVDVAWAVTDSQGIAMVPYRLPSDPSMLGGHVFTQFLVLAPGANTWNILTTNAVDTTIGH